ncbi:hypothetical protein [Bosea sp. AS-1]|jgi:hypothetical protein|uniref:hypothetical protein n=1 Tax=Bosea sp. AS-1 TaxID=2015316 RepID=UPI000B777062|nr:hypothetical protein [Bosea sp. AS-1]
MRAKVQHGASTGEATRPVFGIETAKDYERARNRIASLKDSTRDEDEEHELEALVEAVQRWDADHSARAGGQGRKKP